ncbi:hypothetical protein [Pantoea endophytica]
MKYILYKLIFFVVFLFLNSQIAVAQVCNENVCRGFDVPQKVRGVISDGHEIISLKTYFGHEYFAATTRSNINACSYLFPINLNRISPVPVTDINRPLCNLKEMGNEIVSSWRDAGYWNSSVYQVSSDGEWRLLLTDTCIGCEQIIRKEYFNNKESVFLVSDNDDFRKRTKLKGIVIKEKAYIYTKADGKYRTNAYLIKNDTFTLKEMSIDGLFYKVIYFTKPDGSKEYWIETDDFDFLN